MATENQKQVIQKTLENVRKGKLVNKGEILEKIGYGKSLKKVPSRIYDSKGVKEGLKPFIDKLKQERDRIINEMSIRTLNEVQYKELANVLDILAKNIQILSGGATDIIKVQIEEELKRYADTDSENNSE